MTTPAHPDDSDLREQVSTLTAVIESIDVGILVCDASGRFAVRNRAMSEMLGSVRTAESIEEMVKLRCFFHADGVTPISLDDSVMVGAVDGKTSEGVEVVLRNLEYPEGKHLRVSARPLSTANGAPKGAIVIAHDVTAERRAARELSRQKTVLESVLECVAEVVVVFDPSGGLIRSNAAFDRLIGHRLASGASADERLQWYGRFAIDGSRPLRPEEGPEFRALSGEEVDDFEFLVRIPGREDVVMSTNAQVLRDQQGTLLGVVVTGRNVTDRRLAERDLINQKALLRSILDCLGEGVLVYDPIGRILLQNPAAERLVDPLVSKNDSLESRTAHYGLFTIDGARPFPISESPAGRALVGLSSDDVEILVRSQARPEGTPLSANGRPLLDAGGNVRAAVVTIRDITARRRMEHEKEAILVDLRRSNEELAQFAYVASHDLRAPLRAIETLAGWIDEDLAPHFSAETAEQMRILRQRVKRMDRLLCDLLEYSRVGQTEDESVSVNVEDLVNEVIDLVGPSPGFRLVSDISVDSFDTAAVGLKRALLNLVSNALKHHDRDQGWIRIRASERDTFIEFEVQDDGPGIARKFHDKIFEMFQTLKPRDKVEGSGMGLALVKKLAETAGGRITVESTERGATFRLLWPRKKPERR